MVAETINREHYAAFAAVLSYPAAGLDARVRALANDLSAGSPAAAACLERVATFLATSRLGVVQEVFTSTFDLQPSCCPYVGYQLFGESYKRAAFLVKLQSEYRQRGFVPGVELADHVAVILEFLSRLEDEGLARDLMAECLAPAVAKMHASLGAAGNPYGDVLQALLHVAGYQKDGEALTGPSANGAIAGGAPASAGG